jgi:hypothetical protein
VREGDGVKDSGMVVWRTVLMFPPLTVEDMAGPAARKRPGQKIAPQPQLDECLGWGGLAIAETEFGLSRKGTWIM